MLFDGLPKTFPVIQTHMDAVLDPPTGAVPLATNDLCTHQAYRIGETVRSIQWHPEFDADVISTAPTVPYRVRDGGGKDEEESWTEITSPSALEDASAGRDASGRNRPRAATVEEPMVDATIICASDAVGTIVELCVDRRGAQLEHAHLDDTRVMLRYRLPLGEVASDFSDALKSRTSGFATFDYEDAGWEPSDVVRLDVLVNGHAVDALATLVHRDKATRRGREMCRRLKDALPRQLYEVAVQAAVGGKVLARETISAMRKNVLAKCYGGDVSRKKKLLAKQKEGKRRMRRVGNVDIPAEAFAGLLSTNNR